MATVFAALLALESASRVGRSGVLRGRFLPTGGRSTEFFRIALLSPTTVRCAALALICPLVCQTLGFSGRDDFDPSLISLIIATPSAFSINAAYQRRERAMMALADLRAACWAIHHGAGRWGTEAESMTTSAAVRAVWASFTHEIKVVADQEASPAGKAEAQNQMYADLEVLGECIENVRRNPPAASEADMLALCSVLYADERMLVRSLEQVRVIASTRTPSLLSGFTVLGSTALPVVFAPYFASIALGTDGVPWAAYLLSLLFAMTNGALVSIQEALEDPFDGDTTDDIRLSDFEPPGYEVRVGAGSGKTPLV